MKPLHHALYTLFTFGLMTSTDQAMAALNTCSWTGATGPMTFTVDLGTVYVPKDAPVGSPIGTTNMMKFTQNNENLALGCANDGTASLIFDANVTTRLAPDIVTGRFGRNHPNAVMQTNVAGVGVEAKLGFPFAGGFDNAFDPEVTSIVPYRAVHAKKMGSADMKFAVLSASYTLRKTATIATGPQSLNGAELFSGHLTGVGKAFGVGITGTIIQAQCSVLSNPVSADPVMLGEWEKNDFTGPGYTTAAVPFSITLSDCDTDGDIATAHIRLDGIKGSMPVTPAVAGVFTLTTDSTAEGVGIQILKSDGSTPMELGTEVPLIPISNGMTTLLFNARLYQTGLSEDVKPGLAKGALNFSVTYK